VVGVPWFSEQQSGWEFASFGYIVGFIVAATLVGALAQRGADRKVLSAVWMMILGNLVIYAIGVAWLANWLAVDLPTALEFGVWPFLVGDALKIALAAGLLPAAWTLVGDRAS
jgi:biotin transport system substrate-specific component